MSKRETFVIITLTSLFFLGVGASTLVNKEKNKCPNSSISLTKDNTKNQTDKITESDAVINNDTSDSYKYYQMADAQLSGNVPMPSTLSKEKIDSIISLIKPKKERQPIDTRKFNLVSKSGIKSSISHTEYEVVIPKTSTAIEHTKGNLGIYGYSYPTRKQYNSISLNQLTVLINKYAKIYNIPTNSAINILNQINPKGTNEVVELLDGTTQVGIYRINSSLQALINAMCKRNINLSNVNDNIVAFMIYYNHLKSNTKLSGSNFDNVLIKTLSYRHNK